METTNLNPDRANAEAAAEGNNEKKNSKGRKVAGAAAALAGAAGVGAVGAMAIQDLNAAEIEEAPAAQASGANQTAVNPEETQEAVAEAAIEFDPNDIVINPEDIDAAIIVEPDDILADNGPKPISSFDDVQDEDLMMVNIDIAAADHISEIPVIDIPGTDCDPTDFDAVDISADLYADETPAEDPTDISDLLV